MSHTINHMSFGEKYPGIVNPLDGVIQIADNSKSSILHAVPEQASSVINFPFFCHKLIFFSCISLREEKFC